MRNNIAVFNQRTYKDKHVIWSVKANLELKSARKIKKERRRRNKTTTIIPCQSSEFEVKVEREDKIIESEKKKKQENGNGSSPKIESHQYKHRMHSKLQKRGMNLDGSSEEIQTTRTALSMIGVKFGIDGLWCFVLESDRAVETVAVALPSGETEERQLRQNSHQLLIALSTKSSMT
jgi:hypothetical protein